MRLNEIKPNEGSRKVRLHCVYDGEVGRTDDACNIDATGRVHRDARPIIRS